MNFTILNMSDDSNKGDLAILESTVWLARKYLPKCKIEVLNVDNIDSINCSIKHSGRFKHLRALDINHHTSFLPHVFAGRRKREAILFGFKTLGISLWILAAVFIFREHASFLIPKKHRKAFSAIRSADIVILKGGSYLYSYGGVKNLLFLYRMVLTSIMSIWLGKKVVALGHSIGPVTDRASQLLLTYCLKRFHKVVARENISYRYVLDKLKIDGGKVQLMPDMAFWRQSYPESGHQYQYLRQILEAEGADSGRLHKLKIGLTVRPWKFPLHRNPQEQFKNYVSSVVSVIERLHVEYGATVFIMPHTRSDMVLGQQIAEKAKGAYPILLQGDYSTSVLRELYGMMDLFIGTRIHSDIFALTAGTPVVAIAYEIPKGFGIVSMVEGSDFILDIAKINKEKLWLMVLKLLLQKESMRSIICEKVKIMQQTIEEKYIEVISSALEEK